MTIRVVIADDQELVRIGLRLVLEAYSDIDVIGEAADGIAAIGLATELRPDVIVMDIRMPGVDGIEAVRRIGQLDLDEIPRILMLTTFDHDEYVFEALRAGAAGFLLKDAPRDQLVEAIQVVSRGDGLLAPSVTRRLIESFVAGVVPSPASEELRARLTPREHETWVLMARGMSNAEIARALTVNDTTVKSHVSSILTKLDLRDRVHAVVLAYEHGIVSVGDHPRSAPTPED